MKKVIYSTVLASVVLLSACQKADEEAPVIDAVKIDGVTVTTSAEAWAGQSIVLDIDVSDNEALNQIKIDIHPNEDGHSHGGEDDHDHGADGEWEVLELENVSGTSATVSKTYALGEELRGEWHVGVLVLDAAGNEAQEVFIDLDVENDIIPEIEILTIMGSDVDPDHIHVHEGDVLTMTGSVSDSGGLDEIHVKILDEDGNMLTDAEYEAGGVTSWDLSNVMLTVPVIPDGHGELHVEAKDTEGHVYEWIGELHQD